MFVNTSLPSVEDEMELWSEALECFPIMPEDCKQAISNHIQSLEERNNYLKELEYEQGGRIYSEHTRPEK